MEFTMLNYKIHSINKHKSLQARKNILWQKFAQKAVTKFVSDKLEKYSQRQSKFVVNLPFSSLTHFDSFFFIE
jgi:hypothetical protein